MRIREEFHFFIYEGKFFFREFEDYRDALNHFNQRQFFSEKYKDDRSKKNMNMKKKIGIVSQSQ